MSLEELLIMLLLLAVLAAIGFGLYWVVRRGVRDGARDAAAVRGRGSEGES